MLIKINLVISLLYNFLEDITKINLDKINSKKELIFDDILDEIIEMIFKVK